MASTGKASVWDRLFKSSSAVRRVRPAQARSIPQRTGGHRIHETVASALGDGDKASAPKIPPEIRRQAKNEARKRGVAVVLFRKHDGRYTGVTADDTRRLAELRAETTTRELVTIEPPQPRAPKKTPRKRTTKPEQSKPTAPVRQTARSDDRATPEEPTDEERNDSSTEEPEPSVPHLRLLPRNDSSTKEPESNVPFAHLIPSSERGDYKNWYRAVHNEGMFPLFVHGSINESPTPLTGDVLVRFHNGRRTEYTARVTRAPSGVLRIVALNPDGSIAFKKSEMRNEYWAFGPKGHKHKQPAARPSERTAQKQAPAGAHTRAGVGRHDERGRGASDEQRIVADYKRALAEEGYLPIVEHGRPHQSLREGDELVWFTARGREYFTTRFTPDIEGSGIYSLRGDATNATSPVAAPVHIPPYQLWAFKPVGPRKYDHRLKELKIDVYDPGLLEEIARHVADEYGVLPVDDNGRYHPMLREGDGILKVQPNGLTEYESRFEMHSGKRVLVAVPKRANTPRAILSLSSAYPLQSDKARWFFWPSGPEAGRMEPSPPIPPPAASYEEAIRRYADETEAVFRLQAPEMRPDTVAAIEGYFRALRTEGHQPIIDPDNPREFNPRLKTGDMLVQHTFLGRETYRAEIERGMKASGEDSIRHIWAVPVSKERGYREKPVHVDTRAAGPWSFMSVTQSKPETINDGDTERHTLGAVGTNEGNSEESGVQDGGMNDESMNDAGVSNADVREPDGGTAEPSTIEQRLDRIETMLRNALEVPGIDDAQHDTGAP